MIAALARRLFTEPDARLAARFALRGAWNGWRAVRRFRAGLARGEVLPPFPFLSITDDCNLRCTGCWVTPADPPTHMPLDQLDRIVSDLKAEGLRFFGLLGGEPLRHPDLFEFLGRHRDCLFQVFTNGTLLDADRAEAFRELGNVTPLVSIEGGPAESDRRRGGTGVHADALAALEHCRRARLVTGVACSVCRTNFDEQVSEAFCRDLVRRGVLYAWYYLYRPVGPRPAPGLALDDAGVRRLREFLVDVRSRVPLLVIDAYWDHEGRAVCPAAEGISHHVNPRGDIEPCPVIQFARDRIEDGARLPDLLRRSSFLAASREQLRRMGGGCILLRDPQALRRFVMEEGARDTTGRGSGLDELLAMQPRADHCQPGNALPERHPFYRLAKRTWFFGLGAYG